MSLTTGGPQPTAGSGQIPLELDAEKAVGHSAGSISPNLSTNELDIDGEKVQDFQRGVERIRIITTIWDKPTLISMFVL